MALPSIDNAYLITGLITCGLLVFFYSAALVKVILGSRYKLIIGIISLMLASNIFTVLELVANQQIIEIEADSNENGNMSVWDYV